MKEAAKSLKEQNGPGAEQSGTDFPAYLQLAETLKKLLVEGIYKSGDKIPSEAALSKKYGLALMTVRQAVGVLAEQGLLERVPGRGTYVKELSWSRAPFYIDGLVELVRNPQTKVSIVKTEVKRASLEVAEKLDIALGDSIIFLRRQIGDDKNIFLLQEGYLILDPHRPVVEAELEATYLTGLFTGSGKGMIKKAVLNITPIILNDDEAKLLGHSANTAGFRLEYIFYDSDLAPLALGSFTTPHDTLKLCAQIGLSS